MSSSPAIETLNTLQASNPLLVDQYQLSMMEAYLHQGMNQTAVFELFVRRLPEKRNFLIAAGLEQALGFLENLRFSSEEIEWLNRTGKYSAKFLDYLRDFKFTGDVNAMPEGTLFYPNEPVLQIIAPLPEAQLIETRLINIMNFQSLIASKAARCVLTVQNSGREKTLIDFGLRRAHGFEAGLMAARASYLAGFHGTATVLAEKLFHIPAIGTMAHSYIEAHADEETAFQCFAEVHPKNAIFLIDTYDTLGAARKICKLAPTLARKEIKIKGVRLDSGDLAQYAKQVRNILDEGDLKDTLIFASGNLDEERIRDLLSQNAPIDSFGVGTHLTTSTDAPSLDMVYKLQEYNGKPRLKKSEGKFTWPGQKQVYRTQTTSSSSSESSYDQICLSTEKPPIASNEPRVQSLLQPLLHPMMRNGKRIATSPTLSKVRQFVLQQLDTLPTHLKSLKKAPHPYPVHISDALNHLAKTI